MYKGSYLNVKSLHVFVLLRLCPAENAGGAAGEPQGGSSEAAQPPARRDRRQAEDAGRAHRVRDRHTVLHMQVSR